MNNLLTRARDLFVSLGWHRLLVWGVLSVVLLAVICNVSPHKVELLLWGALKLTVAGYLGYFLTRSLAPYARPDRAGEFLSAQLAAVGLPVVTASGMAVAVVVAAALIFRGLVMLGCLLALGWGQ